MAVTLVIDAGHGGIDPGAVARHNGKLYYEKYLAWELAMLLHNRAARDYAGKIKLHVVPHSPQFVKPTRNLLANRVRFAREKGAQLFISIHWNAAPGQAHGTEAWYRNGNALGEAWAQRLSRAVALAMQTQDRGPKNDKFCRFGAFGILSNHAEGTRACLLEVGFVTAFSDIQKWDLNKERVAKAILDAAVT